MMNQPDSEALEQFTASQAKPAADGAKEYVADHRLIRIDTPQWFRSTEDAVGICILGAIVVIGITVKAMVDAEWRHR